MARVAVGLVLLSQALPRCVLALSAAAALGSGTNFFPSFRNASYAAVALWSVQAACASLLVGSQLVRVVLFASADNFESFELAGSISLLPICAWFVYSAVDGMRDPCGDTP